MTEWEKNARERIRKDRRLRKYEKELMFDAAGLGDEWYEWIATGTRVKDMVEAAIVVRDEWEIIDGLAEEEG